MKVELIAAGLAAAIGLPGFWYSAVKEPAPQAETVSIAADTIAYRPIGNFHRNGKSVVPPEQRRPVAAFEIMKHQVSGADYAACVAAGACKEADSTPAEGSQPQTHVSWHDATAYAAWAGGRLPTEVEWEHAARGALGDVRFPWGDDEPDDETFLPCNIWQGRFPQHNTASDGYAGTAPAASFAPNGYGLYNMAGNVWEWTADDFRIRSLKKQVKERLKSMQGFKLAKGGSFLCHRSYCYRYRIAARSGISPDSTAAHQGFRVAWDG